MYLYLDFMLFNMFLRHTRVNAIFSQTDPTQFFKNGKLAQ